MKIIKKFTWEMAHRLPNHSGKCRNLHGHSYSVEVCLEGRIIQKSGASEEGMIIDFSDLKHLVDTVIMEPLDHSCMVWSKDDVLVKFYTNNPDLKNIIVEFPATVENISRWIYDQLKPRVKDMYSTGLSLAWVRVHETATSTAFYDERGET